MQMLLYWCQTQKQLTLRQGSQWKEEEITIDSKKTEWLLQGGSRFHGGGYLSSAY